MGSDVPFFLGPPAAICRGRGEVIEPVSLLSLHGLVRGKDPELGREFGEALALEARSVGAEVRGGGHPPALLDGVDLVVVRMDDDVSVLYGRCLHRDALMSDGFVRGEDLICGVHSWDYQVRSGISSYNPAERLHRFQAWVEDAQVWVDEDEIRAWSVDNPQPYDREAYQGLY